MIHPHTVLQPAGELGLGVFAEHDIPRGTIVWVRDPLDQGIKASRVQQCPALLRPKIDRYAYVDGRGEYVLCWDNARYVNHSCEPNVLSTGWEFDIAIEDIAAGGQLTTDYGCLNIDEPFECLCRTPSCRRTVRDEDFEVISADWDASVASAFQFVLDVEQPLWSLLVDGAAVRRAALSQDAPPSITLHRRGALLALTGSV